MKAEGFCSRSESVLSQTEENDHGEEEKESCQEKDHQEKEEVTSFSVFLRLEAALNGIVQGCFVFRV